MTQIDAVGSNQRFGIFLICRRLYDVLSYFGRFQFVVTDAFVSRFLFVFLKILN